MRTVNSAYMDQIRRLRYRAAYQFRLVDPDGTVRLIPGRAVQDRSRSGQLDGTTWKCGLTLNADLLRGVNPQRYDRLEIDRIVEGQPYPYFRGIIDRVAPRSDAKAGNSVDVDAFGVLQKTKGYPFPYLYYQTYESLSLYRNLMGIVQTIRTRSDYARTQSEEELLPGTANPYKITSDNYFKISQNADMSSPYVKGTDYGLAVGSDGLARITWQIAPATTRYYEYSAVQCFVMPFTDNDYDNIPTRRWFVVPYGRNWQDLYHTSISSINRTSRTITPTDLTGYYDKLDTVQGEYVTVTCSDGTTKILKVASVSNGVLTIDPSYAIPENLVEKDSIRLSTTEAIAAWRDDMELILYSDNFITPYPADQFEIYQNNGQVISVKPFSWDETKGVWGTANGYRWYGNGGTNNRTESVIKNLLTGRNLFTSSDVETNFTGSFVKNIFMSNTTLDTVIKSISENSLPPNAFIHDTPDGKVSIKAYTQKNTPDWQLRGVMSVEVIDEPEPITSVTIIAEGEEINIAPEALIETKWIDKPSYLIDNDSSLTASSTIPDTKGMYAKFRIKAPATPYQFPYIESIRVKGQGILNVYTSNNANIETRYATLPEANNKTFGASGSEEVVISGENLNRFLIYPVDGPLGYLDIVVGVTKSSTSPAKISEIKIMTKRQFAWTAGLTDQTSSSSLIYSDANNGTDSFGTIWRQSNIKKGMSWRYAPASFLKRVSVKYNAVGDQVPRVDIKSLKGISAQDCRDYAERYLDSYLAGSTTYKVEAPFDDRAELGDTVQIRHPQTGELLNLMLWGMDDGGGPGDQMVTYTMIDYGV